MIRFSTVCFQDKYSLLCRFDIIIKDGGGTWVTCFLLAETELAVTAHVNTLWKKFRELLQTRGQFHQQVYDVFLS